jgi:flagellar assembly protein FliH
MAKRSRLIKAHDTDALQLRPLALPSLDSPTTSTATRPDDPSGKDHEQRLAHLEREAYERGFDEGERAGRALAEQKSHDELSRLARAVAEFEAERARLLANLHHELADVVLQAASRIVEAELEADPALVRYAVEQALQAQQLACGLKLRLHPRDQQRLQALLRDRAGEAVSVIADATLTPGGCVVSGPRGEVDATLETRLTEIAASLKRAAQQAEGAAAEAPR